MITLDTSGLLAALDPAQKHHAAAKAALMAAEPPLLLSPFVLAELDYLVTKYASAVAARQLLGEVAAGAYNLVSFNSDAIASCLDVIDRHWAIGLGIADASVWHIATLYQSYDVLTLDEHHFRLLTTTGGLPLRLLPADA